MKKTFGMSLGFFFLLSLSMGAVVRTPSNSSLGYRGVVLANEDRFNGPGQEIIADFGAAGVWAYEEGWHQLTGVNPDWMFGATLGNLEDDEVIAGFGALGLWMWDYNGYPGNWIQLSGVNPKWGFASDDDGDGMDELIIDFGPVGIWHYDHYNTVWTQLSGLDGTNGLRAARQTGGVASTILSFPGVGVWQISWPAQTPQYLQLTGTVTNETAHASGQFLGGTAEDLVMDFGGALGLWILPHDTDSAWERISPLDASRARTVKFDAKDTLLLDFDNDNGLYLWDGLGYGLANLHKLTDIDLDAGFLEPLDIDGSTEITGDEELAVDLGASGLWIYDHTGGSWTKISSADPVFMVAGDYWGEGYAGTLLVDFGTLGLWRYHALTKQWDQLSGVSPDEALN